MQEQVPGVEVPSPSYSVEPTPPSKPTTSRRNIVILVMVVVFGSALVYLLTLFTLGQPPQINPESGSQQFNRTNPNTALVSESDQVASDSHEVATVSASPPSQTPNLERSQQTVIDFDSLEWNTFVSELGFSFDYPSFWGTPKEKIVDAVESLQGDSGKVYTLTFSDTQVVYGSGRSADFSAGRGGMPEDFGINSDGRSQVEAYLDIVDPGCYTMGTHNSFNGYVDFSLAGKPIGGVRLFLPIVSTAVYEQISQEHALPETAVDCFENAEIQNQFIAKGDAIRSALLAKTNVDQETSTNLDIFTKIASSSTILN